MQQPKPVAAACALIALLVLSALALGNGGEAHAPRDFFVVSIKQYGVDAREMERTVTIPLEDALYALPEVKSVSSVTENAQSRVSVLFKREGGLLSGRGGGDGRYEAVSGAASRVYERLPASAQRPEILSEDGQTVPVWTAAARMKAGSGAGGGAALSRFLERTVKPALLALPGAAGVEIAGNGVAEIIIALDNSRCTSLGLSPSDVAMSLARDDGLWPAGVLTAGGVETTVTVDGRYRNLDELRGALIPLPKGAAVRLDTVARVIEQERVPDVISRLNGEKTALVSVTAEGGSAGGQNGVNLWRLSRRLSQKIAEYGAEGEGVTFEVLVDRGAEEGRAWRSLAFAALSGAVLTALLTFLVTGFSGGGRTAAAAAFSVPVMCVLSLGVLAALSRPVDQAVLAGLAAGSGAAVDAAILVTEHYFRKKPLRTLFGPLFAGSATTIAALLPLFMMKNAQSGVQTIALCIAVMTAVSFPTAFVLLPPLLGDDKTPVSPKKAGNRLKKAGFSKKRAIQRRFIRIFARILFISVMRPGRCVGFCAALTLIAVAAVVVGWKGEGRGAEAAESVYAQVEFEGGLPVEESDARLARYAAALLKTEGITHIETAAKPGRGNVSVSFDSARLKPAAVRRLLRERASTDAEGGFVYIGEETADERNWRITVFGADDRVCRSIAQKLAGASAAIPVVEEAVLHFKDGGPRRTLRPRREALSQSVSDPGDGRSRALFLELGDLARRAVHAPVAYKRLSGGDGADGGTGAAETDVRIRTETRENGDTAQSAPPSLEALMRLRTANRNQNTGASDTPLLESLVTVEDGVEIAGINREDRRRTASFGVRTRPMSALKARAVILGGLPLAGLPPGYTAVFDREAVEAEESLRGSVFYFVLSLFFCYIALAAAAESFMLPFLPLLATPPSLAFPFLALSLGGFPVNGAAVCAFIAVTGITINAGVLSVDALKTAFANRLAVRPPSQVSTHQFLSIIYRALRGRLGALFATSATSAAAALPFLFLRENTNAAVRMLAFVSAFGVTGSALMSVTLIPALWAVFWVRRRPGLNGVRCTLPRG